MAQDAIINRWDINGDVYDIQDAGRGRPLGVATLDENGRVPYTQLPESGGTDIEVYPTISDLEQDLPNLEDGTIVATEEGDAFTTVDTVQSGVYNPVTSNAVAQVTNERSEYKVLPFEYNAHFWYKLGKIDGGTSQTFPFAIFQIDIMGYARESRYARYIAQVGIYDRGTFTRRVNIIPVVTATEALYVAIDDALNVWIQIGNAYMGGFVLTYVGDRLFERDFVVGDNSSEGVPSGFTSILTLGCNSSTVTGTF